MTGAEVRARLRVERGGFRLDAQLDARAGEVVALMGPSGAGKSTVLGALAGFVPLDRGALNDGAVLLDGAAASEHPHRRGVVLLGQDPRLFPHLSARENVAFGPRAQGVHRRAAREAADEWLERAGLAGFAARRPTELSGGQQQRVALARALATEPRVLLLDEPLTALDPATAEGIRAVLCAQLEATGVTTVLVTHDADDAVLLADRMIVLERGTIVQQGAPAEVLREPATPFVRVLAGSATPPQGDALVAAQVVRADATADGVRVLARTPDDAEVELRLPPGVELAPGSEVAVRIGPG